MFILLLNNFAFIIHLDLYIHIFILLKICVNIICIIKNNKQKILDLSFGIFYEIIKSFVVINSK